MTDTSRQDDLKQRIALVIQDLQDVGIKDREAMTFLGGFAINIAKRLAVPTWTAAKSAMTGPQYDELLKTFRDEGNAFHQKGDTKRAYAVQVLALSLVARTQRTDADIASGEQLLDDVIDSAMLALPAGAALRN